MPLVPWLRCSSHRASEEDGGVDGEEADEKSAPEQDSSSPGAIAPADAFVLIDEEGMSIVDRRRADDPGAKSSGAGA